ncbi:hypothetical protein [Schlesneria sp. DSM 10557]|uniref:hypothetical protein n=1 Tax=Schlesneria sp. DSM 10557 TaxID=3044399 RepID=UPI0035A09694
MREFFALRRRKIGLVALAISCALMVGWIRSLVIIDEIGFNRENSYQRLVLMMGGIVWVREVPGPPAGIHDGWLCGRLPPRFRSYATVDGWDSSYLLDLPMREMAAGGFIYGRSQTDDYDLRVWIVPYWSIVFPLTLLSAWLLIGKPRKPAAVQRESNSHEQPNSIFRG